MKVVPDPDVSVSEDHGLLCVDIEVSSPLHGTAWMRLSRGHDKRQNSHQKNEGTDAVFINGETAVAQARSKDPDLWMGRLTAFHSEVTPPPTPDRLHPETARFSQARHREDDCIPVTINARDRQVETG